MAPVHHLGWLHYTVDAMRFIHDSGPWGWALFIGLYALCCLLFVPGSILTIAGGAVYGFFGGAALVLAGNGLGSVLCLLVTRFFLRDWMARKIAANPRLRAIEKAMKSHDWKLVFLTRLSPVMPFSLINYSLGVTSISAWRFLGATELGAVPATLVYVYIGTLIGNLARLGPEIRQHRPIEYLLQGAGLVVAIAVTVYVTRLAARALKPHLG
ncbi:MAG TPA: TVP38/TMEM64 family protein [Candidatus Methylacidiphilales bacterium]|nr:TVP38/TMEM64 family protein [Candidatus Methylacidiphilales bacterium]